jgi:hypothetical protein
LADGGGRREREIIAAHEEWNGIMHMQLLLEQIQYSFLLHFADVAGHVDVA